MDLILANPSGAWALLGIPAVIAIHFFQRQARVRRVTTLFLLEKLSPESVEGRRWERLRSSWPLWLQILAVLFLAFLLMDPRRLKKDSSQSVAIVLDNSFSMDAFRPRVRQELARTVTRLEQAGASTEWTLMETDLSRPSLYHGRSAKDLLEALERWQPSAGTHSPDRALALAQSGLPRNSLVVFVTDRPRPVPGGVELLAVGEPFDNVGFCGVQVFPTQTGLQWRALLRNYSDRPQSREWWARSGEAEGVRQTLSFDGNQILVLEGVFPQGATAASLHLGSDRFTLDDVAALVAPQPRRLTAAVVNADGQARDVLERLVRSLDAIEPAPDPSSAQLRFLVLTDPESSLPDADAMVFLTSEGSGNIQRGVTLTENHPLMQDLNWNGLLLPETAQQFKFLPSDEILLWQGSRPLIALRSQNGRRQLLFNIDLNGSNLSRLPAFVILAHRFTGLVRAGQDSFEAANYELGQRLDLPSTHGRLLGFDLVDARDGAKAGPETSSSSGLPRQAPFLPSFFDIRVGDRPFLRGAAQFADAREGDFRTAGAADTVSAAAVRQSLRNSRADLLVPLWTALLGVLILLVWNLQGRKARP